MKRFWVLVVLAALGFNAASAPFAAAGAKADSEALLRLTMAILQDQKAITKVTKTLSPSEQVAADGIWNSGQDARTCLSELTTLLEIQSVMACASDRSVVKSYFAQLRELALDRLDEDIRHSGAQTSLSSDPDLIATALELRDHLRDARAATAAAGK